MASNDKGKWMHCSGAVVVVILLLVVVAIPSPGPVRAVAQSALPDVDVVLVAQLQDASGWLALHQEVLRTSPQAKPLRVSLPAGTGGARSLLVHQPKFSVEIITTQGYTLLKLGLTGKIPAADALEDVTPFEQAAMEVQAGAVRNELSLQFGLSVVTGQLLELYLARN